MSELTAPIETKLHIPDEARNVLDETELQGLDFLIANPRITILMHFSKHKKAEDLGSESFFEAPMSESDIYAMENLRHEPDEQSILDDVSKRRFSIEHIARATDGATTRTLTAVHNTGINAIITDVGANHRLSGETDTSLFIPLLGVSLVTHNHDPAHPMAKVLAEDIAEKENAREWIVLLELGNKIENLSSSDPEIAKKLASGALRVFMTFGANHTDLYHKLRKLGLNPHRTFPNKPFIYDSISKVMRQKMFERSQ